MVILKSKTESPLEVKAMFVVPKKKFKDAVDRNKLKRRMREAYRLQKANFYKLNDSSQLIELAFIYVGNKPEEYSVIFKAFTTLLTKP